MGSSAFSRGVAEDVRMFADVFVDVCEALLSEPLLGVHAIAFLERLLLVEEYRLSVSLHLSSNSHCEHIL